jgi:FAD-linked sulfhydryl oxidase
MHAVLLAVFLLCAFHSTNNSTHSFIHSFIRSLIHSFTLQAAWYPDKPSKQDQSQIKQFFVALARFYPCPWCASDFSNKIQEKPIQTETRKDLCVWLCEQHNMVNEKLGKPLFSCNIKELDERWRRSSHPECSNNNNNYYTQQRKQQQQDAEERE